jgi:hypothetical protein
MTSRSRLVRAFAFAQGQEHGCRFEADFDSGTDWHLSWGNGPTVDTVNTHAAKADLGGATLRCHRSYGQKALAVTAIRMTREGAFNPDAGGWRKADSQVQEAIWDIDHPDRRTTTCTIGWPAS